MGKSNYAWTMLGNWRKSFKNLSDCHRIVCNKILPQSILTEPEEDIDIMKGNIATALHETREL